MLYTFVEEQKKKKIHVAATYFVSGMCKSVDGCQVLEWINCFIIPLCIFSMLNYDKPAIFILTTCSMKKFLC